MAVALLSPGVLIREVDLTVGRAENVLDNIGGICGPFQKGPVDDCYTIETFSPHEIHSSICIFFKTKKRKTDLKSGFR